jgi:hypothetical protein
MANGMAPSRLSIRATQFEGVRMTCHLFLFPIALPFDCGDGFWWTWAIGWTWAIAGTLLTLAAAMLAAATK